MFFFSFLCDFLVKACVHSIYRSICELMKDQQVSTIAIYQVKLIAQGLGKNNNFIQNFSLVWYIGLERLLLKVAATALTCSCENKHKVGLFIASPPSQSQCSSVTSALTTFWSSVTTFSCQGPKRVKTQFVSKLNS